MQHTKPTVKHERLLNCQGRGVCLKAASKNFSAAAAAARVGVVLIEGRVEFSVSCATATSLRLPTDIVTYCTAPHAPGHRRVAEDVCSAGAHNTDGFRSVLHRDVASFPPKQVPTAFNRSYEHARLSASSTKRHLRRANRSACSPRPRDARHRCRASQRPGADPCAW